MHGFFIASGLAIGVLLFSEQGFSSLVISIFVTHSFCHKMVSIIHSCMVFHSNMASVLRMQSQLCSERELSVECVYYEC